MDVHHLFTGLPRVRRVSVVTAPRGFGTFMDFNFGFTYVFAGQARYRVENDWFTARRGHCILRPPYVVHQIAPLPGRAFVQWLVTFEAGTDHDRVWPYPWVVALDTARRRQIEARFRSLHAFHRHYVTESPLRSLARLFEIMDIYLANTDRRAAMSAADVHGWALVNRAVAFITTCYRQPLTLNEIAAEVGVSQTTLSRTFHRLMGLTPRRYLNLVRVRKARALLRDREMNCSQVAAQVGFSSVFVFSKVFKRLDGQSPQQWLRSGTQIYGGTDVPPECESLRRQDGAAGPDRVRT